MNISLFNFFYSFSHQSSWVDSLIKFIAVDLIYIMVCVAGIFIVIHYKLYVVKNVPSIVREKWKGIVSIPLAAGIAWVIADILKNGIHTTRPFIRFSYVNPFFLENGYAFPSGHATAISALAFAIYYKNKRLGLLFMIAALAIGIARVAAGVHFPVDIIGGYVLGFLVAFFTKTL